MNPVGAVRKAEILDAAAEVFASSGIRASLKDISDACGILPGSLYYYFDSKEAIVIELVRRYQSELDLLAEEAIKHFDSSVTSPLTAIDELGTAIAECGVRNRAALLLAFYDPPSASGPEMLDLTARSPQTTVSAMHELLRRANESGLLSAGIDLAALADRLCQSMLHVGLGVYHQNSGAQQVPALKCQMLLNGVATRIPGDLSLDTSEAMSAANAVIGGWAKEKEGSDDRASLILDAARSEFGRRGYESTTIRDVASAAGVNPGAVYRVVESKEELLGAILSPYVSSVNEGWNAVMGSRATPIEKLDALLWLDINILDRFSEEHRIQSVGESNRPERSNLGLSLPPRLHQLQNLLAAGESSGEVSVPGPSAAVRVRCVFSLIWTPESIIRSLGTRGALQFARETLIRGVVARSGQTARQVVASPHSP